MIIESAQSIIPSMYFLHIDEDIDREVVSLGATLISGGKENPTTLVFLDTYIN